MLRQSNIEYLATDGRKGYNWPFYTGCDHWQTGVCGGGGKDFYCWAKRRADRFNKGDFTPTWQPEHLLDPLRLKKPSKIAVCFGGDLFGDWVDPDESVRYRDKYGDTYIQFLRSIVFEVINSCPQHTFLFLTKAPWNLLKWGRFPDNAWVGASATNQKTHNEAIACLSGIQASIKFISYEPLLSEIKLEGAYDLSGMQWVILGAATAPYRPPERVWISGITEACRKAGIPYWLKNNLKPLLGDKPRQGLPQ